MFIATGTFLSKNPNYDYIYYDNARRRLFLQTHYPAEILRAYDDIIPGAYKADLFRYCVLYITGGVYVDTGMIDLCPLDDVIKDNDVFLSPEDNGIVGILNGFICCQAGNPIIGEAIRLSVLNIQNREYTHSSLGITGPLLLSKAFFNITGYCVQAGRDYGNGVRLLTYFRPYECASGEIHGPSIITGKDVRIISTRSPMYRRDQKWYNNKKPNYSDLWRDRKVYDE